MKMPIPPAVIEAYRRGCAARGDANCVICDEGKFDREAYRQAERDLVALLGLKPWECSPIETNDGPSPWPAGTAGAISWPKAQALRRRLDAAIADSA